MPGRFSLACAVPKLVHRPLNAEMPLAEDQHVVQALTAKCSNEPPRE
jgi:hypothetical protein